MKTIDINLTTLVESYSIIEQNNLGNVVFEHNNEFEFLRIPFYIDLQHANSNLKLYCFLKKEAAIALEFENNKLSISFNGAAAYITPTWLNNVTSFDYNFQSIHINGKATLLKEKSNEIFTNYIDQMEAKILRATSDKIDLEILVNNAMQQFDVYEIEITKFENANHLSNSLAETEKLKIIQELKKQNEFNALLLAFEMEQAIKKSKRNNKV